MRFDINITQSSTKLNAAYKSIWSTKYIFALIFHKNYTGNGTALLNIPLKTLINDKKVNVCCNYKCTIHL